MENNYNKAYLLFLKYVLNIINSFNALFQSRNVLIHKMYGASVNILKELCSNYIKLNVLVNKSLEDVNVVDPNNYWAAKDMVLGTECGNYIKDFSAEATELVKNKCLEFYITAALEIKKRLPINNHLFQQLKFLEPKVALHEVTDEVDINFEIIIGQLNENVELNILQSEWRRMNILINGNEKARLLLLPIDEFWYCISSMKDYFDTYLYQNIYKLAKSCLSLPHSNAEAERIFSIVTDVKTKKCNRIRDDTLNSVAVIRSAYGAKNINCLNFEVTKKYLALNNSDNLYKK